MQKSIEIFVFRPKIAIFRRAGKTVPTRGGGEVIKSITFSESTSEFSIFTLKDVDEIVFEAYLVAY